MFYNDDPPAAIQRQTGRCAPCPLQGRTTPQGMLLHYLLIQNASRMHRSQTRAFPAVRRNPPEHHVRAHDLANPASTGAFGARISNTFSRNRADKPAQEVHRGSHHHNHTKYNLAHALQGRSGRSQVRPEASRLRGQVRPGGTHEGGAVPTGRGRLLLPIQPRRRRRGRGVNGGPQGHSIHGGRQIPDGILISS